MFGTENISYTYYKTHTGDEGSYRYGDELETTFFKNDTPAGTYYVLVKIEGTVNYTALTFGGTIEVKRHTLTLAWEYGRLSADDEGTVTYNTLSIDSSIMTYVGASENLVGLVKVEENTVTAQIAYIVGSYSVTIGLTDKDNYRWDRSIVDGSNESNCIVKFTVSELENKVQIAVSDGWTYGDEYTLYIGVDPTEEKYLITVVVSSMLDGDAGNVRLSFARHIEGVTDGADSRLNYNIYDEPTAAGVYWVRVVATGEDNYGVGTGYAKFEIAKRALTKPTEFTEDLVYNGGVLTYRPSFTGGLTVSGNDVHYTLPNEKTETVASLDGNTYINAGSYQAIVSLSDT